MRCVLPAGAYYGTIVKRRVAAELTLTETAYAPDMTIPEHAHAQAYFCTVLQGSFTETSGRQVRSCTPFGVIYHPQHEAHADRFGSTGGRCFNVELAPTLLERVRAYAVDINHPAELHAGLPLWLAARLYDEFYRADTAATLAIEALSLELLVAAFRQQQPLGERTPPRWLAQARDLLHERVADTVTVTEVAHAVGVHPVHLARVFRHQYGCTPAAYVRRLRIDVACRALADSDRSLLDIALAAGFADQSHFSRVFKQTTGCTPLQYRRALQPR